MALKLRRGSGPAIIATALIVLAFTPIAVRAYQNYTSDGERAGGRLALTAPLPEKIPPDTTLIIGDPTTQRVLQFTGWDKQLPFHVLWANITGGPGVTEAFHAKALDIGSAANIPPINAIWVGMPVKIIAVKLRRDPVDHPFYVLGIAPKVRVDRLADLRGKRIAFSRGQAQGAVVLRSLQLAGLTPRDVTLVDLPTNGQVYNGALGNGSVDVAPLVYGAATHRYLADFGKDGARLRPHGKFRDDPVILYVRTETLEDPAKAAAIRAYIQFWTRASAWVDSHLDEFTQVYYVKDQGLSQADAHFATAALGLSYIPRNWDETIRFQQETIDLMSRGADQKGFAAGPLFDRRFEKVSNDAYDEFIAHPQSFPLRK